MAYKELKVKLRPGKKRLTFNFSIHFLADGTLEYMGDKWDAPFIVPPDHPQIQKLLQRGDCSLVELKESKPIIKKEA